MRAFLVDILWAVFLVLFTCSTLHGVGFSYATNDEQLVPVADQGRVEMMMMMFNETRRKLNSFQICSLCRCCVSGSRSYCLSTPCCYAINCNIPNRPFGFCSFTPKTCNCFNCHI